MFQGGVYVLQILDWYCASVAVMFLALMEVVGLAWVYGKYVLKPFVYHCQSVNEISNNVVCATSKTSDQSVHTRSLIRDFASRLSIL